MNLNIMMYLKFFKYNLRGSWKFESDTVHCNILKTAAALLHVIRFDILWISSELLTIVVIGCLGVWSNSMAVWCCSTTNSSPNLQSGFTWNATRQNIIQTVYYANRSEKNIRPDSPFPLQNTGNTGRTRRLTTDNSTTHRSQDFRTIGDC